MTPALDVRTLVLIYVGIRTGQAMVMVYLWSVQRSYPPAKDWAIGALLSAVGLFLFTLRGQAPALVSELMSNVFLLPGWMIFNFGIVKAAGHHPPIKSGLTLCAIALLSLALSVVSSSSYAAQVITQNLVLMSLDLYTAYVCLKASESPKAFTFKLIGILLILSVIACFWRVAGGLFGMLFNYPQTLPRLVWIATSLVIFPMITTLLTLHTSQRLQDEINDQARHDPLTGAYNRRAFDEFASKEWSRTIRHNYPFSVFTVDIDHFKKFNDQHGHQTGDATLIQVSRSAQAALRLDDIWCRYGGEEFVAILPNTQLEQAIAVAERLRIAVEKVIITTPGRLLNVSVSIGVAERTSTHTSWAEVLAASDSALYKAKAGGRNRVVANGNKVPDTRV